MKNASPSPCPFPSIKPTRIEGEGAEAAALRWRAFFREFARSPQGHLLGLASPFHFYDSNFDAIDSHWQALALEFLTYSASGGAIHERIFFSVREALRESGANPRKESGSARYETMKAFLRSIPKNQSTQ